jgi:glycosyltransferase involved in cell wall biosynthesis
MAPRRILYIITKLELGGAQLQTLALIRGLDRQRFAPMLATASAGILVPEARALDSVPVIGVSFLERALNPVYDGIALAQLIRLMRRARPDIVHTHSSKAGILGRIAAHQAGVRAIVHTVHGWSFNEFQPWWQRTLFCSSERACARWTDAIITVSEHDRAQGARQRIGCDAQYRVIRYGIDVAAFCADHPQRTPGAVSIRRAWGVAEAELLVGMIACFKPQKSPLDFVRAAAMTRARIGNAKKVRFVMVGDGMLRAAVLRAARQYGMTDALILAGWRRDIPDVLGACDIIALTSRWEGMPIVALEACAAGKPMVVTDTKGIREVIRSEENGVLVAPADVPAYARALERIIVDEPLRKRFARQARTVLSDEYTHARMCARTQQVYEEIIR